MSREMLAGAPSLRRAVCVLACLPALCGAAPPSAPTEPVPAYLAADSGCALVVGGAFGSAFADARITAFWDDVNARIAARMLERLSAQGYKTAPLTLTRQDQGAEGVIALAAARARCNRLLQVAHEVGEDVRGRYFRYDITLVRLSPTATPGAGNGISVTAVGEFARSYRYARTAAVLETFSAEAFARRVAADLTASGRLVGLR